MYKVEFTPQKTLRFFAPFARKKFISRKERREGAKGAEIQERGSIMKRLKDVLAALVVISFLMFALGRLSYAQPNIPKEKIPSDIPSDVREQIERLYSSNAVERALGAEKLGTMGVWATPAIPFLKGLLDDKTVLKYLPGGTYTSPGAKADIALEKIIGAVKGIEFLLVFALEDENSRVRSIAIMALGKIKDPRAVEPLIAALKDNDANVRGAAAVALGKIKNPRAVEPLIAALKDKDVRGTAAVVLGKIKDPRAVEPLIAVLKDEDMWVRMKAAWAVRNITGQDFGEDTAKWQEWWDKNKGKFNK